MLKLREYQQEAVESLWDYLCTKDGNPLVVMPTGSGKSVVQAAAVERATSEYPGTRILCATHVAELISQNHDQFKKLCPDVSAGIYSAGVGRRDTSVDVLFAGVQSIYKKVDDLGSFDWLMVDEAHLVPNKDDGMYRRLIEDMEANNRDLRTIGQTATPYRLDSGLLTQGPNNVFTSVCYDTDVIRLIDEGWLTPLIPHVGREHYDVSGVRIRGGDFAIGDLGRVLESSEGITRSAVEETIAEGVDRKSWLVFCGSVKQAQLVNDLMQVSGIDSVLVTGKTKKTLRKKIVSAFKDGAIRCLINVGVYTTGFDAPNVDLISLMRPTHSPGLHVQMLGRGMRLFPGKVNCLVLDFGGNVARHGPINRVKVPRRKTGTGEAPVKMCPECMYDGIHASALVCTECGYEFPPHEVEIGGRSLLDIITRKHRQRVPITKVEYGIHKKKKGDKISKTLRVKYFSGGMMSVASEFVAVEHDGYAGKKALSWLRARLGDEEMDMLFPLTVEAVYGIRDKLRVPREVLLDTSGKHPSVLSHFFNQEDING